MAKVTPFRKPMRGYEFEEHVRERAKISHMVVYTDHLVKRMGERSVTRRQVLNVLRKGCVLKDPIFDRETASYEGKITYTGTGRKIAVVCAISDGDLYVTGITTH